MRANISFTKEMQARKAIPFLAVFLLLAVSVFAESGQKNASAKFFLETEFSSGGWAESVEGLGEIYLL